MAGLVNKSQGDISKAISRILVVQAVVSGLVAIVIIGGALFLASKEGFEQQAFDLLQSWGGVVIGFYFGTAFAQISTLIRATAGAVEPASGMAASTPQQLTSDDAVAPASNIPTR